MFLVQAVLVVVLVCVVRSVGHINPLLVIGGFVLMIGFCRIK